MSNIHLEEHCRKLYEKEQLDFRRYSLRRLVKNYLKNGKVLDLGCGYGHISFELARLGYEVTSVDTSCKMVKFIKDNSKNFSIKAEAMDACEINKLGKAVFGNVVCLDLLEHIEKDGDVLKKINYCIKDNGILILVVPAIKKLFGIRDQRLGHYRRYSKRELICKLEKANFRIHKIRYWNFTGFLPYLFYEKLLRKEINDDIRNNEHCLNHIFNKILKTMLILENHISLPIGLSLFAVASKSHGYIFNYYN